jgi:hypothetical protein
VARPKGVNGCSFVALVFHSTQKKKEVQISFSSISLIAKRSGYRRGGQIRSKRELTFLICRRTFNTK